MERHQTWIYFGAVLAAALLSYTFPNGLDLAPAINPALALMLFVTFLQVPLGELRRDVFRRRFMAALLLGNFILVPVLVGTLFPFLPQEPLIRLGVLLVLLTPCIDYVVTFAHMGRADARLLLAATPVLLIMQMVLLPLYLRLFLGVDAAQIVQWAPFLAAFTWLIAAPLALAALLQRYASHSALAARSVKALARWPVPATAGVLFLIVATVMPQLHQAAHATVQVVPVYIVFAVIAPLLGWVTARWLKLEPPASRAVAFSTGTRNSLVILPLALAVPGAMPLLPAIVVTQTMVELLGELAYIRLLPRLGRSPRS